MITSLQSSWRAKSMALILCCVIAMTTTRNQAYAGEMVIKVGGRTVPWVTLHDSRKLPGWLKEIADDPGVESVLAIVDFVEQVFSAIGTAKTTAEFLGLLPQRANEMKILADHIIASVTDHIDDREVEELSADAAAHVQNWGELLRNDPTQPRFWDFMVDSQQTLNRMEQKALKGTPQKAAAIGPAYVALATLRLAAQRARQSLFGTRFDQMSIDIEMNDAMQLAYELVGAERGFVMTHGQKRLVRTFRDSKLYRISRYC